MVEIGAVKAPRQVGALSVWLAVGTFLVTLVTIVGFYQIPQSSVVWNAAIGIMMFVFFIAAPIAHIAGFILGLIATFREGDRHGLGILGTVLNALFVSVGVSLVYLALQGLSGFR